MFVSSLGDAYKYSVNSLSTLSVHHGLALAFPFSMWFYVVLSFVWQYNYYNAAIN